MRQVDEYAQYIVSIIGGIIIGLLGGMDGFLYALLVLMVIDYGSGLSVAINNKTVSSEIGAKGINKKVHILLLVVVANIVDKNIVGGGSAVRSSVILFYIINESISIIENSSNLGLPIPKKLRKILEQLEDEEEADDKQ